MTTATATYTQADATHETARDELILNNLGLVKQSVSRISAHLPPYVDREDLMEAGMVGLVDAANRFDPDRKVRFSTYAVTRIRGAMLDALRNEDWLPRSMRNELTRLERARERLEHDKGGRATTAELARKLQVSCKKVDTMNVVARSCLHHSLSDLPGDIVDHECATTSGVTNTETHPAERVMLDEQKELLAQAIADLSPKERLVVSLYYFEQMNLREIAEMLKVTNSRVCQIHRGALRKLHRKLKSFDAIPVANAG